LDGLDGLPLDAELRVLDEGSPVGWRRISDFDRPLYPAGAMPMLLDWLAGVRD